LKEEKRLGNHEKERTLPSSDLEKKRDRRIRQESAKRRGGDRIARGEERAGVPRKGEGRGGLSGFKRNWKVRRREGGGESAGRGKLIRRGEKGRPSLN